MEISISQIWEAIGEAWWGGLKFGALGFLFGVILFIVFRKTKLLRRKNSLFQFLTWG